MFAGSNMGPGHGIGQWRWEVASATPITLAAEHYRSRRRGPADFIDCVCTRRSGNVISGRASVNGFEAGFIAVCV